MKARQIVLLGLTVAMASIPALAENAGAFSALGPSEHIDVPCDTSELIDAINTANSDDEGYTLNLAAGTMRVKDIYAGGGSSSPSELAEVNGTLFFGADDGSSGDELWKSDGTEAGTVRVRDINAGPGSSSPYYLTNVNGTLFFSADDASSYSGKELWKSDGTEAGTVRVKDIYPGHDTSHPYWLTNVNGTLFFIADDGSSGRELWKSDGTAAGTVRVRDIYPGTGSSELGSLTNVNGTLFFSASDASSGRALWKSDGTAAGTVRVKDIYSDWLTNVNGTLFFSADDASSGSGWELWKSDGTEAGTVRVRDIYPGPGSSSPYYLTNVNGTLLFRADDGSSGVELWKSDGTEAGTVRVKDIYPGTGTSYPSDLTNVNGTLFFSADDGSSGGELWKSDGTEAGTVRVKDIYPGTGSLPPHYLANVNGTLFFRADDGSSGGELWKSDGTEAGTVRVKDIYPGTGTSNPAWLTNVNGTLFFSADDGSSGRELWKSDGTAAGCTYTLTEVNNDIHGPNGLPSITSAITINGNGATIERSATAADLRILHVATGGDLTLNALAVTGGRISGNGGAIYNANGTVTLIDSTVSNNMVGGFVGGGVYNAGILHSINSTIDGNTAAQGGGIYNTGIVNLSNTAVISNAGVADTGSGGIFNTDVGSITLTHSIVSGNTANNACAGIFSSGTMVLASTVISGNSGTGIVNGCGGIENHGNLTVSHSTIRDNIGTNEGGGIRNGPSGNLTLVNSTISGNAAYKGGGIYNSGTMTLTNCTVSDNEAYSDGGGIDTYHGTLSLKSSIVATNRIEGGGQSSDCVGTIISLGHNLDSDGTCNLTKPTDLPEVDPLLGPLQDNGGPTWTRALLPGSPAIDRAGSSCPPTDQRGAPRPQDGDGDSTALCDIGAYELQPLILNVRAFIDGRSHLIVRGDTAYWHHYDFAAPGRHFDAPGGNVPTFLNGAEWCPSWPGDPPDLEPCAPVNNMVSWCNCDSSSYVGIPKLPAKLQKVGLEVIQARYRVSIVQQPDQSNGYTLIVEFDDNPLGGNDWYEIVLIYLEEPTAIGLLSFTAQAGTDHVTLAWETGTEVDNAGFNLWRSEAADGPYAKINDTLIPAEGDAVSGASYTYVDADVVAGVTYYYKLEDVDIHGASTFHGPVSARPGRPHLTYLPIVLR